jgi:hypothetical protein
MTAPYAETDAADASAAVWTCPPGCAGERARAAELAPSQCSRRAAGAVEQREGAVGLIYALGMIYALAAL